MPLSVNVGLSRKASRDFQSAGASINIVAEIDQSLLARPEELQRQIDDLYLQAHSALERQPLESMTTGDGVGGMPGYAHGANCDAPGPPGYANGSHGYAASAGNGRFSAYRDSGEPVRRQGLYRSGNGQRSGNGTTARGGGGAGRSGRGSGPATDSQRRAIHAIAARVGVDPSAEARDIVGVDLPDLTLRQASDLIDHLKAMTPTSGNGRP